jgi:flagellar biosynthesis component FlhA
MDSVKPSFSGAHEELLEDAVSIEDIDEVLEKLATAGITGTESDEPAIGEASSSAAQAEDDDSRLVSWTRLRIRSASICARWVLYLFSSASRKFR